MPRKGCMFKKIAIIIISSSLTTINVYAHVSTVIPNTSVSATQPLTNNNPYLIVPEHLVKRFYIGGTVRAIGFASNHTPTTIGTIPSYAGRSPGSTDLILSTAIFTANAELTDWISTVLAMAYEQTS